MERSDMMKFWKLLTDVKFTGRPSRLTEDEVKAMGKAAGLLEPEVEAVVRGLQEIQGTEK